DRAAILDHAIGKNEPTARRDPHPDNSEKQCDRDNADYRRDDPWRDIPIEIAVSGRAIFPVAVAEAAQFAEISAARTATPAPANERGKRDRQPFRDIERTKQDHFHPLERSPKRRDDLDLRRS